MITSKKVAVALSCRWAAADHDSPWHVALLFSQQAGEWFSSASRQRNALTSAVQILVESRRHEMLGLGD